MVTPELLGLPYSPWSEKARWALEARAIPYRFRRYAPVVGEALLRLKLRKWTGAVSVPVLTAEQGTAVADSTGTGRWADDRGSGPRLFPAELDGAIVQLVGSSERGLAAGRGLSLRRMLTDDEALLEMVPRPLRPLGRAAAGVGSIGVRR